MTLVTLEGNLGADREVRLTRSRTLTQRSWNPVAECHDEYEITTPRREFILMSLAEHHGERPNRKTTWHKLVIWNAARMEHFNAWMARKGQKVTVTGRHKTYRFIGQDGQPKVWTCFEVETFHRWIDQKTPPQMLRSRAA